MIGEPNGEIVEIPRFLPLEFLFGFDPLNKERY